MEDMEAIKILLEYDNMLTPSNIFYFVLRFLGWGIIKFLEMVVNSAQGVLNNIMAFLNFFDSKVVGDIIDKIQPFAIMFLTISLLYIAYQFMLNKKFDKSKIPTNVIVAILIIFLLPTVMKSLGTITQESFKMFTNNNGTIASEVISSNITDVYLLDKDNFKNKDIHPTNNVSKGDITKISPVEEIDRGKVKNKKIFENETTPAIEETSGHELKRINGFFKIDSEYYRWNINFFNIIATLLISAVVLVFTMVKVVKLMIELAFSKIFIIGGALADISYGQKTKQMLIHILSIYISIISVGLTINLYILATAWLNNNLDGFASIMVSFGAGLFVIDGPNLLEKIFGVDAGLSSGIRMLMGLNSGLDIMSKIGKGASAAANVGKKGLEVGAIAGAGLAGLKMANVPSLEDDMNNNKGFDPLQKSLSENDNIKGLETEGDNNEDIGNNGNATNQNDLDPNSTIDSNINEDSNDKENDIGMSSIDDLDNSNISTLEDDKVEDGLNNGISEIENKEEIPSLEEDLNNSDTSRNMDFVNNSNGDNSNDELRPEGDKEEIASLDDNLNNSDIPRSSDFDNNKGNSNRNNNNSSSNNGSLEDDILKNPNTTRMNELDNYNVNGDNFTMGNSESGIQSDSIDGLNSKVGDTNTNYPKNINGLTNSDTRDWEYGNNSSDDFTNQGANYNGNMNNTSNGMNRGREYVSNYMDSSETRNIMDIISGSMSNKIDGIANGELASKMKTSYKIGNNTGKDLNRYVGIKKDQVRDKIVNERIRRDL